MQTLKRISLFKSAYTNIFISLSHCGWISVLKFERKIKIQRALKIFFKCNTSTPFLLPLLPRHCWLGVNDPDAAVEGLGWSPLPPPGQRPIEKGATSKDVGVPQVGLG